ncbi:hypothetical protein G5714_010227 [Onychostoma macrolepis]|uniref:PHD-type domain-containing protein n=1 Tax=Onychostoma macrolepis TaxID=369639 RepID=A0A7J6CQ99_9TELE|nr:hypothetical protein G5714_010227 [Onychostoma macrolepis]
MGSDQFKFLNKIICALCEKSDETEITGPLSSKGNISAHQNCLLFASGIYCKNSPTYDDLFGFDVDDVKKELKRGKRLLCHHCKKNGATAGCDVKRCKRSYHYPCAIEDRGRALEDRFILFCKLHDPESPQKSLPDGRRPNMKRPDRRDSDSSTGSSEVSLPKKKKNSCFLDSDDEIESMYAPVQSNIEYCTPPNQNNWSTPVPKKTRLCKKLNPSTTEADDDTDIDSEESQSLLPSKPYCITIPCSVILDSGPSAESEHSLEPSSPVGAAPAAVSTSSGSVTAPEHKETPSTNRTSPSPTAPSTEPVSPGQAGSPQHSSPTVDVPELLISSVQTISASRFKSEQLPVTPPAGVSSSPGRPTAADASGVGTTVSSKSSATIFWTRCNEAGWTKEIFSELVSQLSSLGERVQSQKASHQDYDVALKVLGASGRLPCIITQLQQDLEKQEQDLQKKKAALRDAKAVLDV